MNTSPLIEVKTERRRLCVCCLGDTDRVLHVGTKEHMQRLALCVDCAWLVKDAIDRGY